jgi:hypothetical protein
MITPNNPAELTILENTNLKFTVRNDATGLTAYVEREHSFATNWDVTVGTDDGEFNNDLQRTDLSRGVAMAYAIDAVA